MRRSFSQVLLSGVLSLTMVACGGDSSSSGGVTNGAQTQNTGMGPAGGGASVTIGSGAEGADCTFGTDCGAGLACAKERGAALGQCRPFPAECPNPPTCDCALALCAQMAGSSCSVGSMDDPASSITVACNGGLSSGSDSGSDMNYASGGAAQGPETTPSEGPSAGGAIGADPNSGMGNTGGMRTADDMGELPTMMVAESCDGREIPTLHTNAGQDADSYTLSGALEATDDFRGSCSEEMGVAADTVVSFTAPKAGTWIFSTLGSNYDTVLYARSTCADGQTELDCNDDSGLGETQEDGLTSRITVPLEAGQEIFIFVDAYDTSMGGDFNYTLSANLEIPPVVTSADYLFDPETGTFEMYVTGTDPESDTASASIDFLDADGVNILEGSVTLDFTGLKFGENDAFSGLIFAVAGPEFPEFTTVKITVVDSKSQRSAPFDATVAMSEEVAAGEACDGVTRGCGAGYVCSERACVDQAPFAACPAEWTVTSIELEADGSATVQGNNSMVMNEYRVGSCGGGGATEVYSFVANADGTYVVNLDGMAADAEDEPDTVLYARDLCNFQYGSDGADLACNDDRVLADENGEGGDYNSTVEFTATNGQTIYLFTDVYLGPFGAPWTGAYTLTISRRQ